MPVQVRLVVEVGSTQQALDLVNEVAAKVREVHSVKVSKTVEFKFVGGS